MLKNSKKFLSILARTTDEHINSVLVPKKDEAIDVLMNRLLNLAGQKIVAGVSSPKGQFLARLTMSVYEIYGMYESLLDSEVYICRFPYSKTRITKSRHLQHVFANYLNNVYILKERLKNFLKLLEDVYAVNEQRKNVKRITQPLFTSNSRFFDDFVSVRGIHVHTESYSDSELDRLGVIENFVSDGRLELETRQHWKTYFETQFKNIRKEKTEVISTNNKNVQNLLEDFFTKIYSIVIDEDEYVRIPI